MNRSTANLIGIVSLAAIALLAVYFFAEVGFCAGALDGAFGRCLTTVAANHARAPLSLIGWPAAALGLLVAARVMPRGRGR